ncbi:cellobiose phosphorylase [Bacillus sp. FJAT-27264]|uniref:GH36-type glycosyl hydrolase domain-containing protein n=1 Tax=Paenibacillus sp. (strain DSM 101736 / FJAT-27264) TaxID=1850362 RepID=UPI000807F650|nr:amylo-alpha-1,6-glucosidase [Bacillus sp. FJAT-27264]OBZ09781.1 cellobiose phosphorylase [Bacillus sp. FJAT-27264]
MTTNNTNISLSTGELSFTFLNSGDVFKASYGRTMINQLLSSLLDGALSNLYLRLHLDGGIQAFPLLGIRSSSTVRQDGNRVVWEGQAGHVEYQVVFTLGSDSIWFWDVKLTGSDVEVDLVYGQDVGIADIGAVRSNEAYLSQYIDHAVFEDSTKGYVVCSRQNQPQGGKFPYLQQGSLTGATGFSTDGFQFFGLSYKETNEPESLSREKLANEVYQYEFAYTALQSARVKLDGNARFVFYGLFKENHQDAVTGLEFADEITGAWNAVKDAEVQSGAVAERPALTSELGAPLAALSLTTEEINALYPVRHQEEWEGDTLLSFFTDTYEHVVLKEKELLVERPHGHILMSGDNARLNDKVITTTSYMYGIFNSQVVIGNTNFNKLMTNPRNALNIAKTSGQRIYVQIDGQYRLLTMPSLFEIGFNYARWHYKTENEVFIITNYTTANEPELLLNVRAESGTAYRYLVTNQITMNVNEYELAYKVKQENGSIIFQADSESLSSDVYPELQYRFQLQGAELSLTDESKLVIGVAPEKAPLAVLELSSSAEWTLSIQGLLDGQALPERQTTVEAEIASYREFYTGVMNGFHLSNKNGEEGELFKVNALAWWYTHNMLVHYSVPHGLEQYGGAAWGTRDVCQGPVEYFMATHKYEQVREIILTIFAHQYEDDGNWPQWFMFDKYTKIQQEESHGDIIVWPLKVLGDYLAVTRDYGILQEQLPYTRKHSFDFTEETASLLDHARKEIGYIQSHFLHDTHLSSYGDGDWDDTLQPANPQLKQYMVSSWTVALTYQTLNRFSKVLETVDAGIAQELGKLAEGIREDFNTHMLQSEVIPGFLYMEDPEQVKLMVHPSDTETGIQYRLLPMTRSMISELLTPEQAEAHYAVIQDKLFCPDGVRLMNRPAQYVGGVSKHFKRAEQASNFGREIGLQYVHAHIRYVEAMAKLGKNDQVWSGLAAINPIGIRDVVPNAELRQANSYFSSSDGKFNTRYEAQEGFDKLRTGDVAVKGGWRIYSSGPGIYMNQLISNALGIRQEGGDLILDPILPESLDGMKFAFEYAGAKVDFIYHLTGGDISRVTVNGNDVATKDNHNRYRSGGVRIDRKDYDQFSKAEGNVVEIYL